MKKLVMIVSLMSLVLALSGIGNAADVTFTDNQKYWGDGAGWGVNQAWNTDVPNPGWNGNTIDVIGDPNILGGVAAFDAQGNLARITFDYTAPYSTWAMLAPGNLFINILNGPTDTIWDYVVTTMGTPVNDADGIPPSLAAGNYNLYDISSLNIDAKRGANDARYVLSGADNTGAWAGYYLRNNHPIGITISDNDLNLLGLNAGSASFSGFPGDVNDGSPWTGTSSYDFGNGLNLQGNGIIIGWEVTCANDVVYAQVNNPVPEPATLLLLGLGLMGLAGIRRKFKK